MNEVGYDFAAFGNHEFDYTLPQLQKLIDKAKYQYLCCNLTYTGKDGKGLTGYKAYEIKTYGDIKVAFVGIDTPESFTKSTPTYFQDANGNFVYSFAEGNKGADLYNKVQETVDAAKKDGATYVVALPHLGVDESSEPWRSTDLIANTTGIGRRARRPLPFHHWPWSWLRTRTARRSPCPPRAQSSSTSAN